MFIQLKYVRDFFMGGAADKSESLMSWMNQRRL